MRMMDSEIRAILTDRTALAGTAWAEGRGDWRQGNSSVEERIAVMCCVRNRLKSAGKFMATEQTYKGIVLARLQFSCWNTGDDPNHVALMDLMQRIVTGLPSGDPVFDETLFLADGVIRGLILDRTNGATFYFAPKAMKPAGKMPKEAVKFAATGGRFADIGDQRFYQV